MRATSTPHDLPLRDLESIRIAVKTSDDRQHRLVRDLLRPDERFLAVVYAPAIYLWADRLPASNLFYYLPVLAKYAARPVAGYRFDLCRDFAAARPKIVFFLDRIGDGRYGFADYEPCVHAAIVADYVPLPWAPEYHVRRDIVAARPDMLRMEELGGGLGPETSAGGTRRFRPHRFPSSSGAARPTQGARPGRARGSVNPSTDRGRGRRLGLEKSYFFFFFAVFFFVFFFAAMVAPLCHQQVESSPRENSRGSLNRSV
jgi:hypothetical protein